MTIQELKQFSDLCRAILEYPQTGFARNKKFIKGFFTQKVSRGNFEQVRRRLVIVDALYSTNMSRRLYGIDELAEKISRLPDREICSKFKLALNGRDDKWIDELFNTKYGKKKTNADPAARCFSLITKYAHYLCNFDFPIYDSLVKYYFKDLLEEMKFKSEGNLQMSRYKEVPPKDFFCCLRCLKQETGLSYEKIDYVLWVYGKFAWKSDRSLSLIVTGDEYKKLIKENWFKKEELGFRGIKTILERIKKRRQE